MTNFFDENDDGCCLICESAEEGCLCFNCKCTQCDEYNLDGYCNIANEFKFENRRRWEKTKKEMFEENRILKFCPTCRQKRFMKFFKDDEIADYYCFNCQHYFTKEFLGGMR
jgi:hypothetical protein